MLLYFEDQHKKYIYFKNEIREQINQGTEHENKSNLRTNYPNFFLKIKV